MGDMGEAMTEFLTDRASITGVWEDYRTYMHQDFINWLCRGGHPQAEEESLFFSDDWGDWIELETRILLEKCKEIARDIYRELGSDYEECVYHKAFEVALRLEGIDFESKKVIPIYYKEHNVGDNEADLVVHNKNGEVVIELKTIKTQLNEEHMAQLGKYLEGLEIKTGLLINFWKTGANKKLDEPEFVISYPTSPPSLPPDPPG